MIQERRQREAIFSLPVDGLGLFSGPPVERRDWLVSNAGLQISLPLLCANCGEVKGRSFGGCFHLMNSRLVKLLCPQATAQQPALQQGENKEHICFLIKFYNSCFLRDNTDSISVFISYEKPIKQKKQEVGASDSKTRATFSSSTILFATKYYPNQCSKPFKSLNTLTKCIFTLIIKSISDDKGTESII